MKRRTDVDFAAAQREYEADLAFIDELCSKQVAEVSAIAPTPVSAAENHIVGVNEKVFDQTWVGEDGKLYYDFQIHGTDLSLREWEAG